MKKALILFLILILSTSLLAQGTTDLSSKDRKISIGLTLGQEPIPMVPGTPVSLNDFPNIYFGYKISSMRIESHVGLIRIGGKIEYNDMDGNVVETGKMSNQYIDFGISIHFLKSYGPVSMYCGPLFGAIFSCNKMSYDGEDPDDDFEEDTGANDLYFGLGCGAEWFPTANKMFSIGGEVQGVYVKIHKNNIDMIVGYPPDGIDFSASIIKLRTMLFIRWYF